MFLGLAIIQALHLRAVVGTHFATRVPAYQYPAGTRLLGVACSQVMSKCFCRDCRDLGCPTVKRQLSVATTALLFTALLYTYDRYLTYNPVHNSCRVLIPFTTI